MGLWTVITVMLAIQVITTGLVFESHGVGPEASETMGTAFHLLLGLVFGCFVRVDQIAAAVLTEAAYHLGYVDFDADDEAERLKAVWGGA